MDLARCYVSDLDLFDRVKDGVPTSRTGGSLDAHARRYWDNVIPLDIYRPGRLRRPEVMIVGDVAAEAIEIAVSN